MTEMFQRAKIKLVTFVHRARYWIALLFWSEIGLRSSCFYALLADGKDFDFLLNPFPISLAMGCLLILPIAWFFLLPYVVSFFAYVKLFRFKITQHVDARIWNLLISCIGGALWSYA